MQQHNWEVTSHYNPLFFLRNYSHTCNLSTFFSCCQKTRHHFWITDGWFKSLNLTLRFHSSLKPDASFKWTIIHRGPSRGNKQTKKLCHVLQHSSLCVMHFKITPVLRNDIFKSESCYVATQRQNYDEQRRCLRAGLSSNPPNALLSFFITPIH